MQFQRNDKKRSAQPASGGGGPQRICSRQKSIRSDTARDFFSQTPHMRGKAPEPSQNPYQPRITPACAGKSMPRHVLRRFPADHPRMCGEKMLTGDTTDEETGSPPRMRGKEIRHLIEVRFVGITPAYAGKSRRWCILHGRRWDHPRTCREKAKKLGKNFKLVGSPPHMRGKASLHIAGAPKFRITPAHAGKSRQQSDPALDRQDHPRACGEKSDGI